MALKGTKLSLDSPVNNFATWNSLAGSSTLSNGNLKAVDGKAISTLGMTSKKWYSEYLITDKPSGGNADIGIFSNTSGDPATVGVDDGAKSCSMRYGTTEPKNGHQKRTCTLKITRFLQKRVESESLSDERTTTTANA